MSIRLFTPLALAAALAPAAFAQLPADRPPLWIPMMATSVSRMESEVRTRSAALKRDAFIVSQIVAATAELDDFQRHTALEKAKNRIEAAQKRAAEDPPATKSTFETLGTIAEWVAKAQDQAGMADLPGLRVQIINRSQPLQRELFARIDGLRKDRQAIADIQTKLNALGGEVDEGMTQALGSTLDYFRAGGK